MGRDHNGKVSAVSATVWVAFLAAAVIAAPARYVVDSFVQGRVDGIFPWGTFVVNVTGCLALGIVAGVAARHGLSAPARTVIGTGGIGTYTTFSTFSFETVRLVEEGAGATALWNVAANLGLGLVATAVGLAVAAAL